YAYPGDPGCGTPSYNFTPISEPESGKNFYAVLYGDVTGNWQPASSFTAASSSSSLEEERAIEADRTRAAQLALEPVPLDGRPSAGGAELSIGGGLAPMHAGERRTLTIDLRNAGGILGLDLGLRFD